MLGELHAVLATITNDADGRPIVRSAWLLVDHRVGARLRGLEAARVDLDVAPVGVASVKARTPIASP